MVTPCARGDENMYFRPHAQGEPGNEATEKIHCSRTSLPIVSLECGFLRPLPSPLTVIRIYTHMHTASRYSVRPERGWRNDQEIVKRDISESGMEYTLLPTPTEFRQLKH